MKILNSSNDDMKFYSPVSVLTGGCMNNTNSTNKIPSKDEGPKVLTRNGLKLKNRESRIERRNRINQRRVGKRSSLRLNKPLTNVLKVNRASRQAADLCTGMNLDGDPSKKLLFMLSLGLVPNADKFHGPVVRLDSISVNADEVPKNAKSVTYQSAKENVEDGLVRSCCRVEEARVHSLSERKLRSNQYVNKIAETKPERTALSACKLKTNKSGKVAENISFCTKTDVISKRANSNRNHSFRGIQFLSARVKSNRKDIICIDLTKNEEEILFID